METGISRAGTLAFVVLAFSLVCLMIFAHIAEASATATPSTTASSTPSTQQATSTALSSASTGSTSSPQASLGQAATSTSSNSTVAIDVPIPNPLLPQISSVGATSSATLTVITWQTNNIISSGAVLYGTTTAYAATSTSDLALDHSVALTGLLPGTLYHFQIDATTNAGTATSNDRTFTTPAARSTSSGAAPVISMITVVPSYSLATVSWTTDEPSSSEVLYDTNSYASSTTGDPELAQLPTTNHVITLSGLAQGTIYYFEVVSANASGLSATSSAETFTTASM